MKKNLLYIGLFFVMVYTAASQPALNQSNVTVQGGNITWLDIDGDQGTSIWQGFFGTVTGGIVLEDASGSNMYDWNLVKAEGEILATRYIVSDWSKVNCTNQTEIYQEEERLNIANSSSQGINDTFLNTTHPSFEIAGRLMTGCRSTLTDNSTNPKVVFWNVLLNANSTTTIYTAIMQDDTIGFNGTAVDFQLMVPTNYSTGQAVYNLYLEYN